MKNQEITRRRLHQQRLSSTTLHDPKEVVSWLGAVQAQDYAGAKWALGQRLVDPSDAALDGAFNDGSLLRTHLLRPTWHFVAPGDIRWLLALTAPRVHAANAFMYRRLELDGATLKKSHVVLEKALRGNNHLTRPEIGTALAKAGIQAEGLRLTYSVMSAELDGILCSGPRRGKQFTYALLEERVPSAKLMKRDEALAELTRRYFATRGPATLQDFVVWSGLTMADAKNGLESVRSLFRSAVINDQTCWFSETDLPAGERSPGAYLLPNYDEYFIGFKDRNAISEIVRKAGLSENSAALIANVIVLHGQVVGSWRRTLEKRRVLVELNPITKLTKPETRAITDAAGRFGRFLGLTVELTWNKPIPQG